MPRKKKKNQGNLNPMSFFGIATGMSPEDISKKLDPVPNLSKWTASAYDKNMDSASAGEENIKPTFRVSLGEDGAPLGVGVIAQQFPIRHSDISFEKASEIASKYSYKTYLVSEHIDDPYRFLPLPVAYYLIAYGALPADAFILSFNHVGAAKDELDLLIDEGCTLIEDDIHFGQPAIISYEDSNSAEGEVSDSSSLGSIFALDDGTLAGVRLEYVGKLPKSVTDWAALQFFATFILNCCFIGRGCPAGYDLRYHVKALASDLPLMREFVDRITFGKKQIPDSISEASIPNWREELLWKTRSTHRFFHALTRDENFRERFSFAPFSLQVPELASFVSLAEDMGYAMIEMLYAYERGKDNTLKDIKYDEPGAPDALAKMIEDLGMRDIVDALTIGIPVRDLFLSPHDEKGGSN